MTKLSMTVQTHPDRFEAVLFEGPFVVVRAYDNDAGVSLFLRTPADCDALIAAAVEAKRLLDPPEVVVFTDEDDDAPAQVPDWCPSDSPLGSYGCTRKRGHDGPHQCVEPLTGKASAEWAATS